MLFQFISSLKNVYVLAALLNSHLTSSQSIKCNGYSELCNRPYSSIAFPATHNSFAYDTNNIASNQNKPITAQLDDGVRAFMLDLHKPLSASSLQAALSSNNNKRQQTLPVANIELCHTTCLLLDTGSFVKTLSLFKTYLDANKNEVITLILENYDNFASSEIYSNFQNAGLSDYLFNPNSYSNITSNAVWPTLNQIISTGKRLIVFSSTTNDATNYPQIINQSAYISQTSFEVASSLTSPQTPPNFSCIITPSPKKSLVILNHFVFVNKLIGTVTYEVPNANASAYVNTLDSTISHFNLCSPLSIFANFIAFDFYDVGDLFKAVASINNLSFSQQTTNTFPQSVSTSKSTNSTPPLSFTPNSILSFFALLLSVLSVLNL
ncbi:PI-PLC X domain-containing protein [Smittium culicis]|uniref:PI-PLC X domain-containing protein n=1 Tax=Smittium culicis TaxID=133412 RepID=A0A1R1Y149_9FUNG|nr:PI-PLC X domain-containing protein [Smittium culicis]OMJ20681.1 PI-PLC X domain-containing protein [Smittium culicis]